MVRFGTATPIPLPGGVPLLWTTFGGAPQFIAIALMLATMKNRFFVVMTAFIKTEPVQTAVFGLVFLGEAIRLRTLAFLAFALTDAASVRTLSRFKYFSPASFPVASSTRVRPDATCSAWF